MTAGGGPGGLWQVASGYQWFVDLPPVYPWPIKGDTMAMGKAARQLARLYGLSQRQAEELVAYVDQELREAQLKETQRASAFYWGVATGEDEPEPEWVHLRCEYCGQPWRDWKGSHKCLSCTAPEELMQ